MKKIEDYENPFDAIDEFEKAIGEYTGAKGVIVTDSCTHAMELGLIRSRPKVYGSIPAHTYISVLMTLEKLGSAYMLTDEEWIDSYNIGGSNVWDYARKFEKDMYVPGQVQCLSFGRSKPLELGRGGAILTNNKQDYQWFKRAAYDGRNLNFKHWGEQKEFEIGYHYMMKPEECVDGLNKLEAGVFNTDQTGFKYPDLREITINK